MNVYDLFIKKKKTEMSVDRFFGSEGTEGYGKEMLKQDVANQQPQARFSDGVSYLMRHLTLRREK
jgi:hypothetical protein